MYKVFTGEQQKFTIMKTIEKESNS